MQTTTPLMLQAFRVPNRAIPWLMWGLGLSFASLQFWTQLAMGHMGSRIMRDFSLDALGLSHLSASFFYVFLFMQIPSGIMLDKYGPAKVLKLAIAALSVGCFLFATATELWVAYMGRFLMGAGSAFGFVGMLTLAAGWFDAKRFVIIVALSEMVCLLIVSIGQFFLPVVIEALGWRFVIQLSGVISAIVLMLTWMLVYDGPNTIKAKTRVKFAELKKHLFKKNSLLNALMSGSISVMLTVFIPLWGLPFLLRVHDLNYIQAGWGVAIVVLGIAAGSPFFSMLANYLGQKRPVLLVCIVLEFILMTILLTVHPLPKAWLYPLLFVLGMASSIYILSFSIAKDLAPEGFQGVAMAFTNMITMIGSIVIQPIVGFLLYLSEYEYILDGVPIYSSHDYRVSFIVFPICFAAAFIFAWNLNEKDDVVGELNT